VQPNPAASLQRGCPVRPWSSLTALIRAQRGACDPWADAARAAPGMLLRPTLRIGSRVTLSTYREFRGRHLKKDNCRELVTLPPDLPAMEAPELSPKGEGAERAGRGPQMEGSLLKREATKFLSSTRMMGFLG
jgi:hypothetical protein